MKISSRLRGGRFLPPVLFLLAGFSLPPQAAAQSILDVAALVTLTPARLSAAEGDSFTWTVNLSTPVDAPLSITWTATDGSAQVEADLQSSTGRVEIDAGATSAPIIIPVTADALVEGDEIFFISIAGNSLPPGVSISDTIATGTILNAANISVADAGAAEGDGALRFTVSLSQALSSDLALGLRYTGGSADLDADFGSLPVSFTIAAGDTSAAFDVPITDDGAAEGAESFSVSIGADSLPRGVRITDATATGTITDAGTTLVSLAPARLSVAEGGSFTWTVDLSAAVDAPLGITWTATDGSNLSPDAAAATVADDLVASSGTVEIGTGDTSAAITIPIAADALSEADEVFTVTITGNGDLPGGVALAPSASSAIGTIVEEALSATLSLADARAAEGDGAMRFTVSLSQALGSDVALVLAYSGGSATLGRDLGVRLPGRVIIPAGRTSASFDVPITDDGVAEGEETFSVSIGGGLPQGVTIVDATATGTITDTEHDTTLGSFVPASRSITAGSALAATATSALMGIELPRPLAGMP